MVKTFKSSQLVVIVALVASLAASCRKKTAAEGEGGDLTGASTTQVVVSGDQPVTGNQDVSVVTDSEGGSTATTGNANDSVIPAVGAAGALSVSAGANSVVLSWTKATDNKSAASDLEYCVYQANFAINALTDIQDTAGVLRTDVLLIGSCTKNIATKEVFGLTSSSQYYFNVTVKDLKGNIAAYAGLGVQTSGDIIDPVPQGAPAGTLTVSSSTPTGMTLGWTAATDNQTSGMSLQYRVVYSLSDSPAANVDTVDGIFDSLGGLLPHIVAVNDWTEDITQLAVTGLSPATTYYFNVIVRDLAANRAVYLKKAHATPADTTAPVVGGSGTITASAIGNQTATLTWTKASDATSAQSALQYEVRRSSSNNITGVANAESNGSIVQAYSTNIATFNATGLNPSTTYYFNVIVKDAAGNKSAYTTRSFATLADGTAPTPGNAGTITTSAVTTTGMTLNWTKATDDISSQSLLQYRAYYSTSNNIGTVLDAIASGTPIGAFATDINTVNVTGLNSATSYYFNVIARDEAGNMSIYTAKQQTTSTDVTAPTPGNSGTITTASVGAQTLTLNWTAAGDDTFAANTLQYRVFLSSSNDMNSVANAEARTAQNAYTANITTLNITGLSPSTTYYFNVVVKDSAGTPNKAIYTTVSVTTASDSVAPTVGNSGTITTTNVTTTSMDINWTEATDNADAQGLLEYLVYRSTTNNLGSVANIEANGTPIGSYAAAISTINVTGLSNGVTYYFNVIARDTANNKVAYTTKTQATLTDTTAPTPGNSGTISTASVGSDTLTLNWTTGTDDTFAANTLQYRVFRSTANDMGSVANTEARTAQNAFTTNINTLNITGLSPNTTYYFNIVVRDSAGTPNKAIYTTVQVTTSADSVPPAPGNSGTITTANVANTSLDLNWTKATDLIDAQTALDYRVYYSTSNNIGTLANALANGTAANAYTTDINTLTVSGLSAATTYYFNVVVKDTAGNDAAYTSKTQATTADVTAPTPGNSGTLSASSVGTTSLSVDWTAGTDNAYSAGSLEYLVYRSTSNNIGSVANAEANGTAVGSYATGISSKSLTGLSPATTYYFNVLVRDPAGNKAASTSFSQATATDTTPPTVGNSGTLTFTSVTPTSMTLNWTKAGDDTYAQSTLVYQACRSTSNNVTSVGACEGATLIGGYIADVASASVTGLTPSTTYYFNVVVKDPATNQSLYTTASQATAADVTAPVPGSSGTMSAANLSATSLDVNWTKATDTVTPQASLQYLLYYSASNNISSVANAEANGTAVGSYAADISTQFISGLTPGATYYFNVIVKDAAVTPNKAVYTTLSQAMPSDGTPPTPGASGSLTINGVQTTQATVNWTAATDVSTPITYLVYYSDSDNLDSVANTEANGTASGSYTSGITSKIVSGLLPNTDYFFNVIAKDNYGNKALYTSNTTTTTADTTEPTAGGSGTITSSSPTPTSVDLSWTKATDDSYLQSTLEYLVYYSTSNNITTDATVVTNGTPYGTWQTNINSITVTGLSPYTDYYFNVLTRDGAANDKSYTSKLQKTIADTTAPVAGASGALTLTMGTTTTVIDWTKATDNLTPQASLTYRAYYSTSNNLDTVANTKANGTAIGAGYVADIAQVTATGLTASTLYYFNVLVKDTAVPSNNETIYVAGSGTTGNDVVAPTAGNSGTMSTSSVQPASFTLTWTQASDNSTTAANMQYEVYRSTTNNITTIANAKANGTLVQAFASQGACGGACSVSVTGLSPSSLYYYQVIARDQALNEVAYTSASVTTAADTVPPVVGGSGTLAFSVPTKVGMTVSFTKGTDDYTPVAGLQYRACISTTVGNVNTVNNCVTNAVGSWTTDVSSIVITGKIPSTDYYVNVLVKDLGSNNSIYTAAQTRTLSAVHITYPDMTNFDMKYVSDYVNGSMAVTTIDTGGGSYSGLVRQSDGKLHLLYNRCTTGTTGVVYYASKVAGAAWSSGTSASTSTGSYTSIALNSSNTVFGSFYQSSVKDLYQLDNTSGWPATATSRDSSSTTIGQFSKTVVDSAGKQHIFYYDSTNSALKYANNVSGWTTVSLDGAAAGNVATGAIVNGTLGNYIGAKIDSGDKMHVIYYDSTNSALRYATNSSGSWVASTLVSANSVGQFGSIAIDPVTEDLHVVYIDATNKDLVYIKYNGTWSAPEVIDNSTDTLQWTSVAVGTDSLVHVAYYDSTTTDLRYVYGETGNWRPMAILDGNTTLGNNTATGATVNAIGRWNQIVAD